MGDLKVGDTVFDENGIPCHVVAKSPVDDTEKAYKLTFKDGTSIIAGERHLWNVSCNSGEKNVTSLEMYKMGAGVKIASSNRPKTDNQAILQSWSIAKENNPQYHYLESIVPVSGRVKMQCIQVDSPSHQYLAGTSFVPTHNSELAAAIALYLLYADNEPSAEVYGAAADRQQASYWYSRHCMTAINTSLFLISGCRGRPLTCVSGVTMFPTMSGSAWDCFISPRARTLVPRTSSELLY